MEKSQETFIAIIRRKGIIEFIVHGVRLSYGIVRSWLWVCILRFRGYNVSYKTYFSGQNRLFQDTTGAISIHDGVHFGRATRLDAGFGGKIIIGKNVLIDDYCFITAQNRVIIGNNVLIAAFSFIADFNHTFDDARTLIVRQGYLASMVTIEDDVWIGTHCLILPGVTVGKGAVVGAGSVVTKDVKPYSIVAGNPAKLIGQRR